MPHDVNVRAIAGAGIAIATTVSMVVVAVFLLLRHWDFPLRVDRVRLPYDLVIKGPALQSAPQDDLAQYHARQQQGLRSRSSADASSQDRVGMPIAEAMERLAQPAGGAASPPRTPP